MNPGQPLEHELLLIFLPSSLQEPQLELKLRHSTHEFGTFMLTVRQAEKVVEQDCCWKALKDKNVTIPFNFRASNNEAEYEVQIARLTLTWQLTARKL